MLYKFLLINQTLTVGQSEYHDFTCYADNEEKAMKTFEESATIPADKNPLETYYKAEAWVNPVTKFDPKIHQINTAEKTVKAPKKKKEPKPKKADK